MSEKMLRCSRYVENFIPQNIIENTVNKICESVADAFLGQIEYGKDYVIKTGLVKEDWADGFGTKYTYNLKFDEVVRCMDCKYFTYADSEHGNNDWCAKHEHIAWSVNGFCACGERRDA